MIKKIIIALGALAVLVLLFIVYQYFLNPIKIGVILTTETTLGHEENLAIRFYSTQYPRIGLRRVDYIIYNPKIDKDEIINAYHDLEKKGVTAIIGGSISRTGVILAKESNRSGIPTLGITTSSHKLSNKKDHYFRIVPSTELQAEIPGKYYSDRNINKIAVITCPKNKPYSEAYAEILEKHFNGQSIRIPFNPDEDIYTTILNENPDIAFCVLPATSFIQVIKELRKNAPHIKIDASAWGTAELFSLFSGPMLDGITVFHHKGNVNEEDKKRLEKFEQIYRVQSSFATIYLFGLLDIVYRGISEVGSKASALNAYLEEPRIYKYGYGRVYMNEYGDGIVENYYIREIEDNTLVFKEEVPISAFPDKME